MMTTLEKVRWPCLLLSEYEILKLRCLELEGIHSEIFLFVRNARMDSISNGNRAGLRVTSR